TFVGFPMILAGATLGTLSFAHIETVAMTPDMQNWAANMATFIGLLLEETALEVPDSQQSVWAEQMSDIQNLAWDFSHKAETTENFLAALYNRLANKIPLVHFSITKFDSSSGTFKPVYQSPLPESHNEGSWFLSEEQYQDQLHEVMNTGES